MNRTPSHRVFLAHLHTFLPLFTCTAWLKVSHDVSCKKVRSSTCRHVSDRALPLFDLTSSSLSSASTPSDFFFSSILVVILWSEPPSLRTTAHTQNEEYCTVAVHTPLTGFEPKQLDNSDYSETCAVIFQNESVDMDTELSYSCDAELDG